MCIGNVALHLIILQWSFGVVCWEIFTCGDIPYPGMSPREVVELLDDGERLLCPDNAACSTEM